MGNLNLAEAWVGRMSSGGARVKKASVATCFSPVPTTPLPVGTLVSDIEAFLPLRSGKITVRDGLPAVEPRARRQQGGLLEHIPRVVQVSA